MNKILIENGWKIRQLEPVQELDPAFAGASPDFRGSPATGTEKADRGWIDAGDMPSMVHAILERNGVIACPWQPGQAQACLWVAEKDWVYSTTFALDAPQDRAFLVFKGLDTITDIWLNGVCIAKNNSMYTPVRIDVSGKLARENVLTLHFRTVFDTSSGTPKPIWFVDNDTWRPVRRSHQNYVDYLGAHPYFSRVGVFGDIFLETHDGSWIEDKVVNVFLSDDLVAGRVDASISGRTSRDGCKVTVTIVHPDGSLVATMSESLPEGAFACRLSPEVRNPELWWPRGYGKQPLYRICIELLDPDGRIVDSSEKKAGFRTVKMPKPLHFVINGLPVRQWGANWVSPHWNTAVWDHEKASRLLDMAEEANMNTFRVWGVTESPDDDFYDMADERGFMIWQDFTDLPLRGDDASIGLCKHEALGLIKRLKHHACIFIWSSGNEDLMWHEEEFGGPGGPWPGKHTAEHSLFMACAELDPQRFYIPNSPYYGIDSNDPKQWDTHGYTNIWYIPGYDFLNYASEDTRIAAPELRSLKRFFKPEHLWPSDYSPVWKPETTYPWPKTWNNYTGSISWKKTGPVQDFYDAESPEELVYRLGMAEAVYYRDTIERQRRGRTADSGPDRFCGGYLVWKFHDSWPEIYSAKVDYFEEPLIPYHIIRRSYAPVLVSIDVDTWIHVWVVNDSIKPVKGTLNVTLFNFEKNAVTKSLQIPCSVDPDQSAPAVRLDQAGIGTFFRENVILATLNDQDGKEIARNVALMDIERRLVFPHARLTVRREENRLYISTDKFARSVVLSGTAAGDEFGWKFDDNYFDLLPGEEKCITVSGRHSSGTITAKPFYSPHATSLWMEP